MKLDIVTIFPRMVEAGLAERVIGRESSGEFWIFRSTTLRDYTTDRPQRGRRAPAAGLEW